MSQTPKLEDVIEAGINERMRNFYTAVPGEVVSYNSDTQRADVRVKLSNAEEDSTGKKRWFQPVIRQAQVVFPGGTASNGGVYRITFPIRAGDHVLYIVSTLPLTEFLERGYANLEIDPVTYNNIAHGFVIPGVHTGDSPGEAPTDAMVLHGDMVKIGSKDASELVALKKDLQNLKSALGSAVISLGAGGAATVATAADTLAGGSWPEGSTKLKVE
jgi:hypothetical protein